MTETSSYKVTVKKGKIEYRVIICLLTIGSKPMLRRLINIHERKLIRFPIWPFPFFRSFVRPLTEIWNSSRKQKDFFWPLMSEIGVRNVSVFNELLLSTSFCDPSFISAAYISVRCSLSEPWKTEIIYWRLNFSCRCGSVVTFSQRIVCYNRRQHNFWGMVVSKGSVSVRVFCANDSVLVISLNGFMYLQLFF